MKKPLLLVALLLLSRCATYKELIPEPQPLAEEGGFLELKKGEKNFELSQGKKYFIAFPAPAEKNFYLVLEASGKDRIVSFLTPDFDLKETYGPKIKDEPFDPSKLSVYAIDNSRPSFFWFIDSVMQDQVLTLKFRYVPQWRFRFEWKYAEYLETLKQNMVNRQTYQALGTGVLIDNFPFPVVMDSVNRHLDALKKVHAELLAIQSIFPKAIINSTDKAYLNYTGLRKELEEEMAFQQSYLLTLRFFRTELECRGNPLGFLDRVPDFIGHFNRKDSLTAAIIKASQERIEKRLFELIPFYDQLFMAKDDFLPPDTLAFRATAFMLLDSLYRVAPITQPEPFKALNNYFRTFDQKSRKLEDLKGVFRMLTQTFKSSAGMPSDDLFMDISSKAAEAMKATPAPLGAEVGNYQNTNCSQKLNAEIEKFRAEANRRFVLYREAEVVVRELNQLKAKADYPGMLALLKSKPQLEFLYEKYQDLDKLSVETQSKSIRTSLEAGDWAGAEARLKALHADKTYLNYPAIQPVKSAAVESLEDSLYTRVDRASRARVNAFCEAKVSVLENIDSLYLDSVFLPAYDITFSSGSRAEFGQKKAQLLADLARLKDDEFPAKSIKLLYEDLNKNLEDRGVEKCRAIVAHGKHYAGSDKDVKQRLSECDPEVPKWITKPADYRRVFALPVSEPGTPKHRYMLRLNIRVDSDAKFPVFDVNLRLPPELARNAAAKSWYERLTLNRKLLKNEGRFSIAAPTAANHYECQITPVQMKKDGDNILEVLFDQKAFKVFPVSVMVQKPIIKKN